MLKHAVAVGLFLVAGHTQAGVIRFDASSAIPGLISGFSVTYNDSSGDGLLQIEEIVAFSGVTILGHSFPVLVSVPTISGIATGLGKWWGFGGVVPLSLPSPVWRYGNSVAAVPEPGSLTLFGIGLLALGFLIQRHSRMTRIRRLRATGHRHVVDADRRDRSARVGVE
jgi:hypothetical protein